MPGLNERLKDLDDRVLGHPTPDPRSWRDQVNYGMWPLMSRRLRLWAAVVLGLTIGGTFLCDRLHAPAVVTGIMVCTIPAGAFLVMAAAMRERRRRYGRDR